MKLTKHKTITSIRPPRPSRGLSERCVGDRATAAGNTAQAHAAHTLRGTETGHLRLVKASGSMLDQEGPATGPLQGHMVARLNLSATFSGSFSIYTERSIAGTARPPRAAQAATKASPAHSPSPAEPAATRIARGQAGLYVTLHQRYDLVIQTTGSLTY